MKITVYTTKDGKVPFQMWLSKLRDKRAKAKIIKRLSIIEFTDHLGDYKVLGGGLLELREHYGPGYRVYCNLQDKELMILLCAGDKSSQPKDIKKARVYLDGHNLK